MDFLGTKPEALVSAAEKAIGFTLPNTYHRFLLELGAGSFGAAEIYGICHADFVNSGIPDAVWCTLQRQSHGMLPPGFLEVHDPGYGPIYCLALKQRDARGECPVVEVYLGPLVDEENPGVLAVDVSEEGKAVEFQGKEVVQRDDLIDPHFTDSAGHTNLERMGRGLPPIGPDGFPIHLVPTDEGSIVEMAQTLYLGAPLDELPPEQVAEDFGSFLLQLVQEELEKPS